ncbi:MAG: PEP-CTERM sorting domain-containing protein, partial [Novosphingobium sp.]
MIRKTLIALTITAGATVAMASPAQATWWKGGSGHTHSCDCGDKTGKKMCGGSTSTSSSTSGGTTTTSGGTTTSTSTSGG